MLKSKHATEAVEATKMTKNCNENKSNRKKQHDKKTTRIINDSDEIVNEQKNCVSKKSAIIVAII